MLIGTKKEIRIHRTIDKRGIKRTFILAKKFLLIKCKWCGKIEWYDSQGGKDGRGNPRTYCSLECKKESFKIMFSGEGNPRFGIKLDKKTRENIGNGIKASWTRERKKEKSIERTSQILSGEFVLAGNTIHGNYVSIKTGEKNMYDSLYEYIRMISLDKDDSIKYWTKNHGIKIRYYNKNKEPRFYLPDFFILFEDGNVIIEEVKGYQRYEKEEVFSLKSLAAQKYCLKNGYRYIILRHDDINDLCGKYMGYSYSGFHKKYRREHG